MESIPDLLDLKGRSWSRQIPSSEVRLAKGEVQKCATALPQNPVF
jgi:hypothetical protein